MDAWVEPKVAPWDMAATQVILEEAGAVFFAFNGKRSIYEGNCVACTPGLEASMREFFAKLPLEVNKLGVHICDSSCCAAIA